MDETDVSSALAPLARGGLPAQKRGASKQDYETPADFIDAVVRRWGPIDFDLAATAANAKAPRFFTPEDNALEQDWSTLRGNLWLNPPFADIAPWAERCALFRAPRWERKIFLLTPASIGSNWFERHVHNEARVLGLVGRLTFVGCADAYPKDCMLSIFGEAPGFDVWRWRR